MYGIMYDGGALMNVHVNVQTKTLQGGNVNKK